MALRSVLTVAEFVSVVLLFAFGVVVVALEAVARGRAQSMVNHYSDVAWQTQHDASRLKDNYYQIKQIGDGTSFSTAHAVLAAGAITLVAGVFASVASLARYIKSPTQVRRAPPLAPKIMPLCGAAAFIAALVVFAYATAKDKMSNSLPLPPGLYIPESQRNITISQPTGANGYHAPLVGPPYGYSLIGQQRAYNNLVYGPAKPYYTVEYWTCGASKLAYETPALNLVCNLSMAARYILIPTFILALVLTGISLYLLRLTTLEFASTNAALEDGSKKTPVIKRMQRQKDFENGVGKPSPKPVTVQKAPQIMKMQKAGREMK